MINLLPDDVKKDIGAARMNVILLRYNLFALMAAGILVGMCVMFFVFLNFSQSSAVASSDENQAKVAQLNEVVTQANAYKQDLATAKQVFDQSINFSEIVFAIAKLVPKGVVLSDISLETSQFDSPITFSAYATDYDEATQLKENFQESSLFTDVYLQNLSDSRNASSGGSGDSGADSGGSEGGSSSKYPISFSINAVIKKAVGLW